MKKNTIIAIILILSIFISSCGSGGTDIGETQLQTGTKGLEMEFIDSSLPNDVMEESSLYTSIELRNEGFQDIKDALLILSLEEDYMMMNRWDLPNDFREIDSNVLSLDIDGKDISNTQGEKQVISMTINTKRIEDTRNKIDSTIVLSTCYKYMTTFSDTLCIDPDPADSLIAEKTCEMKSLPGSSQGGPIAITNVEPKIIPGPSNDEISIQLTISAENKNNGLVLDVSRYKDICMGRNLNTDDYNKLTIENIRFSDFDYRKGDLECTPNPLKETKNGFFTRCKLRDGLGISKSRFTFETPIVIDFKYGYKSTESTTISILNDEADFI